MNPRGLRRGLGPPLPPWPKRPPAPRAPSPAAPPRRRGTSRRGRPSNSTRCSCGPLRNWSVALGCAVCTTRLLSSPPSPPSLPLRVRALCLTHAATSPSPCWVDLWCCCHCDGCAAIYSMTYQTLSLSSLSGLSFFLLLVPHLVCLCVSFSLYLVWFVSVTRRASNRQRRSSGSACSLPFATGKMSSERRKRCAAPLVSRPSAWRDVCFSSLARALAYVLCCVVPHYVVRDFSRFLVPLSLDRILTVLVLLSRIASSFCFVTSRAPGRRWPLAFLSFSAY